MQSSRFAHPFDPLAARARTAEPIAVSGSMAALIVAVTLLYWTTLARTLFPGEDGDVSVTFRLLYFAIYLGTATLILRNPRPAIEAIVSAPALTALLVLPLVSTLWSINPSGTTNRAIAVAGSSAFGLYLAAYLPARQTLALLAMTATLAAVASVVLIVAVPSLGIDQLPPLAGSWTGAFGHKNLLGQMSSLGAIVCLLVVLSRGLRRAPVAAAGFGLNAALLAGSQSLTAQVICLLSVAVILMVHRFVRTIVAFGPVIVCGLAVAILLAASAYSLDDFFELLASLGKDPTLSSRVPLWQSLGPFMMERFWLGYGYEAFWSDTNYAVRIVVERVRFRPWHAHNGLIELWLGLGITGVALMIYVLGRMIGLATARLVYDERNAAWQLAFVFIFQFLVQNFSESSILMRNSMSWSLLVMLAYMVSRPAQISRPALAPQT